MNWDHSGVITKKVWKYHKIENIMMRGCNLKIVVRVLTCLSIAVDVMKCSPQIEITKHNSLQIQNLKVSFVVKKVLPHENNGKIQKVVLRFITQQNKFAIETHSLNLSAYVDDFQRQWIFPLLVSCIVAHNWGLKVCQRFQRQSYKITCFSGAEETRKNLHILRDERDDHIFKNRIISPPLYVSKRNRS